MLGTTSGFMLQYFSFLKDVIVDSFCECYAKNETEFNFCVFACVFQVQDRQEQMVLPEASILN